jgi:hypothetical protein
LVAGDNVGGEKVDMGGSHLLEAEFILERVQRQGRPDEGRVVPNHDGGGPGDSGEAIHPPVVDGGWRRPVFDLGEDTHIRCVVC